MNACVFVLAWVGSCKNPCGEGKSYCPKHIQVKCSCGEQAVSECMQTMGPMICGQATCYGNYCTVHGGRHANLERERERFLELQEQAGYVGAD